MHLVGHSFGARLVSFALLGLAGPDGEAVAGEVGDAAAGRVLALRVRRPLPFDAGRTAALAGMAGPGRRPIVVTASFSSHDRPSAGSTRWPRWPPGTTRPAEDLLVRWGGNGCGRGAGREALLEARHPAPVRTRHDVLVRGREGLNVDASEVVRAGGPPSGAHSDIIHPELAWVCLAAACTVD